jgi:hypothetical protein
MRWPEHVLKYLARYTHRMAISNQRLLAFQDGQVTLAKGEASRKKE